MAGEVSYGPVRFTVASGPSAVDFFRAITRGRGYQTALVRLVAPGETQPYLVPTATNVLLTELVTGDDGKGAGLVETVAFIAETQTLAEGPGAQPEPVEEVGTLQAPEVPDVAISGRRFGIEVPMAVGAPGGSAGAGAVGTEGVDIRIADSKKLAGLFTALQARGRIDPITIDQSTPSTTRTLQPADFFITELSISRGGTAADGTSAFVTFSPSAVTRTAGTRSAAYDFVQRRAF